MSERDLLDPLLEGSGDDHSELGVGGVGRAQVGVVLGDQFEDRLCFGRDPPLAHGADSHRGIELTGGGLNAVSTRLAVNHGMVGGVNGWQPDCLGSQFEGGLDGARIDPPDVSVKHDPAEEMHSGEGVLQRRGT